MATFNMQNQTVTYQYAADTISFGSVHNKADVLRALEMLQQELAKAKSADAAPKDVIVDAESSMQKAVIEARKEVPEKAKVASYLESASKIISGAAALGGLVTAIQKASEVVSKFL